MAKVVTKVSSSGGVTTWRVKCIFCGKTGTLKDSDERPTPYMAALKAGWKLLGPIGDWAGAKCPACSGVRRD